MGRAKALHILPLLALAALGGARAQELPALGDPGQLQRALADARAAGAEAGRRAAVLEQQARSAEATVARTASEAAGIAARIQQAEAAIAVSEAQAALVERDRAALRSRLAQRQEPLVRLTAALQRLSLRPAGFALLRPGSLREAVYLRATLEAMLPEIDRRTADLRAELDRSRALEQQARGHAAALRTAQGQLAERRQQLAVIETRQRLTARAVGGLAAREADRALALAEQTRDLGGLVEGLEAAGRLRSTLAALPGPVLRPAVPAAAVVREASPSPPSPSSSGERLRGFALPLLGQVVSGFGETRTGVPRSRGVTLTARPAAQAVAPAAGRVVFAGPYRGYGQIVIIEHAGGWTTLISGLAALDVEVGDQLVQGAPLGTTGPGAPQVTLELRKDGVPVNPLDQLGG